MSGYTLMPWAPSQWTDSLGSILENGILYFYQAGTLVPKTTYKKADGSEANTNPVVLDAAGRARVWLINDEAYDIVVHNRDDDFEYSVLGVIVRGGAGGSGSTTLFQDSPSVVWSTVTVGGNTYNVATVQPSAVLDYKVKADGSAGDTPGYLVEKITDKLGNTFNVDGSGLKRVVIPLQDYLNKAGGGTVTGATTINDLTVGTFKMPAGAAGMLIIGSDGTVTRQPIPAETGRIRMEADDIIGYARDKIQPGSGMRIDYTNDPDLGEIMSISMINIPEPIMIPAKRIVLGSGTGVTSYVDLTYYNKQLIADAVSVETFYLGAGSYAGFSNKEVRAVPTRNFREGFTQYADGTVRVGANGDYGALKITDSTKIILTANDTTFQIGGKMLDPGVEITEATYTLPVVAAGETRTIRFNGVAGCTITADAAQVPRYRSSSTGQSVVGTAGGQVDAAAIFGTAAGCKVASITLKGISATAVLVVY